MENSEESLASVDAYLRENPQDATAWNVKGVFHAQRKEYGDALRALDQAIQLDSKLAAAHSNRGRVLLTLGREKAGEALKSFDKALKLKPDEIDTLRDKALALRALNRTEDELNIYKKMSMLSKEEWGIWLRLGDLQLEVGDVITSPTYGVIVNIELESDIDGIWNGTKNLLSRSKMEHSPRLLIRVIYKKENFFIGELDKLISLEKDIQDEKLRDIKEVKINLKDFSEKIKENKDKIDKIKVLKDDRCELINIEEIKDIIEFIKF